MVTLVDCPGLNHGLIMEHRRRVWITGGRRGIGRGLVDAFVGADYAVFTCARRPPEVSLPDGVGFIEADLRDADQVERAVSSCVDHLGGIDLLINNAGGSPMVRADEASASFSHKIVALNLLAPLYCATAAQSVMKDQGEGGNIINIASVSGLRPSPQTAVYGAAKAGLIHLSQSLAIEWAPRIRVNSVALGLVETPDSLEHYGGTAGVERVAQTVPVGRMATPHDLAALCLYLDSPSAAYLTGACIPLHGGGEFPAFLSAAKNS